MTKTSLQRAQNIHQARAIQHDEIPIIGVAPKAYLTKKGRVLQQ
ncbi:hypothetical protein [Arthrobacter ipis]|nr:hypothetical protein [Arthrobacter ipis]